MVYHGKYRSPAELLSDTKLSRDEKIEMLEQWRNDKKALMRASDEGMQGEVRTELLIQIKEALRSLR